MSELYRPERSTLEQPEKRSNSTSRLRGRAKLWTALVAVLALGGAGVGIYTQITAPEQDAVSQRATWRAWLSDDTTSAASRLNHNNGSYVRLDGVVVANDWGDLTDGTLLNTITIDENKVDHMNTLGSNLGAWTNTMADGTSFSIDPARSCNNWTAGYWGPSAEYGVAYHPDGGWTSLGWGGVTCQNTLALICVEQVSIHLRRPSRVFATSGMYTGDLGGLAGADAKCQAAADAAGLR